MAKAKRLKRKQSNGQQGGPESANGAASNGTNFSRAQPSNSGNSASNQGGGANRPQSQPKDRHAASKTAHKRAKALMPGGVSSPVRAFNAVGGSPITIVSAKGCGVSDVDDNLYIDYVGSYGPLILGHAADPVVAAVTKTAKKGTSFGMPTQLETRLARLVVDAVPSLELVRFVNSGTEACMSAIRLARAATGRSKIIKITGCYHGHSDAMLVEAGSGPTTLNMPSSPGVPKSVTEHTVLVPYNDLDAVEAALSDHAHDVAALAVEPVAGNMGVIPPEDGYLQGLRRLCDDHGTLLLFDEVMSGFRVDFGGAQNRYGVKPDLTCLGKVVGGGLPCAAYGGRQELMRQVSPDGPVYQAGTLSGNPLAMAAGIASLEALAEDDYAAYDQLEQTSAKLETGLVEAAAQARCPVTVNRVGSMLSVFFVERAGEAVRNYADASSTRTDRYAAFFHAMLEAGICLAPAAFEAWFISTAHDDQAISTTLDAARFAFQAAAAV